MGSYCSPKCSLEWLEVGAHKTSHKWSTCTCTCIVHCTRTVVVNLNPVTDRHSGLHRQTLRSNSSETTRRTQTRLLQAIMPIVYCTVVQYCTVPVRTVSTYSRRCMIASASDRLLAREHRKEEVAVARRHPLPLCTRGPWVGCILCRVTSFCSACSLCQWAHFQPLPYRNCN